MDAFERVKGLIGQDNYNKIKKSSVILFGVGGVGGFVAEALVRSGVGSLTVVDDDTVSVTNINRQIIATVNTVGKLKTDALKERLLTINPDLKLVLINKFVLSENVGEFELNDYDYVIDAVDTVSAKIAVIERAKKANVRVISCMGTGNKLDPLSLKVCDIKNTQNCPLARVMRRELKKREISGVKVVYSQEDKIKPLGGDDQVKFEEKGTAGRVAPQSMIFVPATAGLVIASQVIKDLIGEL